MDDMTLREVLEEVSRFRDERDWDQFHHPKDLVISLNLEATEVLEHFLWRNAEELDDYIATHQEEIGDELADVLYNAVLLAAKLKVDLAAAFKRKMVKNSLKYPVEKSKGSYRKYTELKDS